MGPIPHDFSSYLEQEVMGVGIVGGRIGGWGIENEGGADPVVRNESRTCYLYNRILYLFEYSSKR
jgi:hypothetical protein